MMGKKIGIFLVVVLVVLQFFRVDKANPEVVIQNDFIKYTNADEKTAQLLYSACYDCHSNTTKYPWYANIAPVSWWLKDHVDEAREHLNFSYWTLYSEKKKLHKLHECYEELEEEEMPLESYTWMHSKAKLTKEEREHLEGWFKSFGPFEDAD